MNVTQEIDDFNLNWDSYREPWRAIEFARKLGDKLNEVQEKYDTLAVENMLEVNEICKQRDAAIDALMAIEDIFIDGDDTYEDWKSMGQIAKTFLEKNT
jgi:hypothetical protein